jgi:hypothetical protein
MEAPIRIDGLAALNKALRRIDKDAPKALRLVGNQAADIVVQATRVKMPVLTGAARASVRASSTRTLTRVSAGGKRAPYYPWLDYGGRTGRRKRTVRPYIGGGRYLYPAIAAHRDEIERLLATGLTDVITGAGLEVT